MNFLRYTLLIAVGGSLGAVLRFWCNELIHYFFEKGFPLGTLSINVLGSFLMGFLSIYLAHRFISVNEWRSFLLIGVLGAFTTFSTFSLDTVTLLIDGHYFSAAAYIISSLFISIFAAFFGIWLAIRF